MSLTVPIRNRRFRWASFRLEFCSLCGDFLAVWHGEQLDFPAPRASAGAGESIRATRGTTCRANAVGTGSVSGSETARFPIVTAPYRNQGPKRTETNADLEQLQILRGRYWSVRTIPHRFRSRSAPFPHRFRNTSRDLFLAITRTGICTSPRPKCSKIEQNSRGKKKYRKEDSIFSIIIFFPGFP